MVDEDLTETQSEFAARLGFKPSYITQLKKAGRLVLTANKRRIKVAESISLINATKDPTRQGVAQRHAKEREEQSDPVPPQPPKQDGDAEEMQALSRSRAQSLAEKEKFNALAAKRDYEKSIDALFNRDDVFAYFADAITQIRNAFQALPANIAPQLAAEPDESRIRITLEDEFEHILEELSARLAAFAKKSGA